MTGIGTLQVEPRQSFVLASIVGEVDLTNVRRIAVDLFAAIPNTARALILDLSKTTYLDSRGVQLILDTAEALQTRHQILHLVVPPDSLLRRLFGIIAVSDVASVHPTIDAAVGAIGAGG